MNEANVEVRGLSRGVVVAALATAVGVLPTLLGMGPYVVPTASLQGMGWPAFGLAAALLLDRAPLSRLGWALVALAVTPALVAGIAVLTGQADWAGLELVWAGLGIAPVMAALAVIAWGVEHGRDRMSRRRLVWLVVWSSGLVAAVLIASLHGGPRVAASVTTLGLWSTAGLVYRLVTAPELRRVDEPLIDAAVAVMALLIGAAVGTAVRTAAQRTGMPEPDLSGAFAAILSAALVAPAGLWLRRMFLHRRYGPGSLSTADVAAITADLHTMSGTGRELLGKAAAMVAAASGHRQVGIVLGPEAPELPDRWRYYPLG